MKASTGFRARRGWDVAVAAAILAAVLLGWFTAAGGNHAQAPHPAHPVAHACPSAPATPAARARCTRR